MTVLLCGAAAPARGQDWLVTPQPGVPLHVPATSPPPALLQAPAAPPTMTQPPVSTPPAATYRLPNELQRLLDPYGIGHPPAAMQGVPPVLPSLPLWPAGDSTSRRLFAPPVVAFPHIPVAWLLGF